MDLLNQEKLARESMKNLQEERKRAAMENAGRAYKNVLEHTFAISNMTGTCSIACEKPTHFRMYSKTCPQSDICCYLFNSEQCYHEAPKQDINDTVSDIGLPIGFLEKLYGMNNEGSELFKNEESLVHALKFGFKNHTSFKRSKKQWAATFPPTLPDPDNVIDVAKYALTYMSSIWHHTGTAPMGEVVDHNFRVMGVKGLSIVDASVLNQVTRMNPTASLLMLGRYAGILKLRNRGATTK